MKKIIIVIVVLIIIVLGFYFISNKYNAKPVYNQQINTKDISGGPTSSSKNITVDIKNFAFSPQTINVKLGTKITWINNDSVPHTITSDSDNILNSPTISPGELFSFTFDNIGITNYHCNIHKTMKGTIVVE